MMNPLLIMSHKVIGFIIFVLFIFLPCDLLPQVATFPIKGSDLDSGSCIALKGDWSFYWNKLYSPESFIVDTISPDANIMVPGVWTGVKIDGIPIGNTGYATMRLRIVSDTTVNACIYFKEIVSSGEVWFNGQKLAESGKVGSSINSAIPALKLNKKSVTLQKGPNELIFQVSNYHHRANGLEYAPLLGSCSAIDNYTLKQYAVDFIVIGFLLIMFFYHLGLFVFLRKNIPSLVFSVFCFLSIFRVAVSDNNLIEIYLPSVTWHQLYFFKYFTLYSIVPWAVLLLQTTFEESRKRWVFYSFYIISGLFMLTLLLPSIIYTQLLVIYEIITLLYFGVILGAFLIKYVVQNTSGSAIFLIAMVFLSLTTINDMFFFRDMIPTIELTPLGIFLLVLGQALTLSKRFTKIYFQNIELTTKLDNQNQNLLSIVNKQTEKLKTEKERLKESNHQLRKLYTAIEQLHATVIITDSNGCIEYVNPQFEKTTGYSLEEVKNRKPAEFHSETFSNQIFEELLKTIHSGNVWQGELVSLKKNNTEFVEWAIISPIKNDAGVIVNFITVKDDITHIRNIKQALVESEEKYRLITENATDVIWKVDLGNMRYSYISQAVTLQRGLSVDEAMAEPFVESLTHESYKKAIYDIEKSIKESRNVENFTFRGRYQQPCKNGNIIDIEISASFVYSNGKPIEIIGTTRDITSQVKIEKALAHSEMQLAELLKKQTHKSQALAKQLNDIFNNAFSAIGFLRVEGQNVYFVSCNSRWSQSLGFTPSQMEGGLIDDFCDSETVSLYRKHINTAISTQKPVYEYVYWHNMYLYACIVPIYDDNTGELKYCACFIYNVTDKMQAEMKMHESEEKFRTIFHSSKDAIVLMDFSLNIIDWNQSIFTLLGKKNAQTGNLISQFIAPKYHTDIINRFNALKKGDTLQTSEYEIIRYDGTFVPVEFNSTLVTINQQKLVMCIIRDISARKHLERSLTQIGIQVENRERRKLAADLHDNVGPLLSSLNMCLSLLARKPQVAELSSDINDIRRILKEAITSVREISNNISPQVLINYGIGPALDMFFETKQKLLPVKFENSLGHVRFSEVKETMLYNIIKEAYHNSLKHSQATLVYIKIDYIQNAVTVQYRDNGIGFDMNEKLSHSDTNMGIFSIINRIKNLEADYRIETSPGKGYSLTINFVANE